MATYRASEHHLPYARPNLVNFIIQHINFYSCFTNVSRFGTLVTQLILATFSHKMFDDVERFDAITS